MKDSKLRREAGLLPRKLSPAFTSLSSIVGNPMVLEECICCDTSEQEKEPGNIIENNTALNNIFPASYYKPVTKKTLCGFTSVW